MAKLADFRGQARSAMQHVRIGIGGKRKTKPLKMVNKGAAIAGIRDPTAREHHYLKFEFIERCDST